MYKKNLPHNPHQNLKHKRGGDIHGDYHRRYALRQPHIDVMDHDDAGAWREENLRELSEIPINLVFLEVNSPNIWIWCF